MLFFRRPEDALKALSASDNGFSEVRPVPRSWSCCAISARRSTLPTRRTEDGDGLLFELIAVFDDLLRAVKLTFPRNTRQCWPRVAERLGESPEFASYLAESGLRGRHWKTRCCGAWEQ